MINTHSKYCYKFKERLLGLMFRQEIKELCFPNCRSVHTFFMKKNIDIILADKANKVIAIYKNVPKNKIIYNKKAYYIFELPTNKYKIELSDYIK